MLNSLRKVFGGHQYTKISNIELANLRGQIEAIGKSQGVIEFTMDGTVITANETFLNILGYTLAEAKGQHHGAFVDSAYRTSPEFKAFWAKLNRGEYEAGVYKRIGKDGREVWIQASYNPILDLNGKPFKVVKYATDVTAERLKNADFEGQISAIGKSQGVIEFSMDGHVLSANNTFLDVLGYSLDEAKGQHHSTFVEPAYRSSVEYKEFWARLNRGEYQAGVYKRLGKGGREIWIQASYNPILDLNGKPFKVVKYATDVTAERIKNADFEGQIAAIGKSQGVIEFTMDGKVLAANDTFLNLLGYSLPEAIPNFAEIEYRDKSGNIQLVLSTWFTPIDKSKLLINARIATSRGITPAFVKKTVLKRLFQIILNQDKAILEQTKKNLNLFKAHINQIELLENLNTSNDLIGPYLRKLLDSNNAESLPDKEVLIRI